MPSGRPLLPRSTPAASAVSSRAISAMLDDLAARSVECHSVMVVRHGHVVAEGWWAPYSADRPHLLYSLTKSFTAIAVGLAIADGLLALDDRVVDVLPEHVPADVTAQGRRITAHHLLSMTVGHATNSLEEAWRLEQRDLVKGFLRVPFTWPEGTRHVYDDATTYVLARMVERVTGRRLDELLDDRVFRPMGIDSAEWDHVGSGEVFGFHGLHLPTEAVAAFGELLLRGGRWGDQQLVPSDWVELATRPHIPTQHEEGSVEGADAWCGYGYQFWMSRHGYRGHGAYGQRCVVVPSHDLVVAVTGATEPQDVLDALWEHLLPGIDATEDPVDVTEHARLAERLRRLSLAPVPGSVDPGRSLAARVDGSAPGSALHDGTTVVVDPVDGGWLVRLGADVTVEVGHGGWRESSPLGRPVVACGAWQGDAFVADLYVITTPHRVRLVVDADTGTATATWSTAPLTTPRLELHLRSPLMTRPGHA